MRIPVLCLLILSLCAVPLLAQEKVAEGEYADLKLSKNGNIIGRTETKWTLYSSPAGYHLQSEIGKPDTLRVVQSEELNAQMVPTSIAYDIYPAGETKPAGTVRCEFGQESIICSGHSEEGDTAPSKPFQHRGPFWLYVSNLFAVDLNWLAAGAVNMANLESGKTSIATVTVDGGGDVEWYFDDEEKETLEFVGIETVDIGGTQMSTRHYLFGNEKKPRNVWMAGPGIIVKSTSPDSCDGCGDILVHYKQYQKLIPELPVEPAPKDAGPTK